MNRKQKRMVRIIAVVLAALLGLSAVISAVLSIAYAEEISPAPANKCEITMEYLFEEQALRMSQRLVYTNASEQTLDRVIFYVSANLLRRQSALFYEGDDLNAAFPNGYLPGGVELSSVRVNGENADWGYQGENEAFLRVACALEPDQSCVFEFDCYLLLTANAAFLGVSEGECRLSDFCFTPASLDEKGEFILNAPAACTRYIDTPATDFSVSITLPEGFLVSATGAESCVSNDDGSNTWQISAQNVRDFALVIQNSMEETRLTSSSGVELRCVTDVRGASEEILEIAAEAVDICESWFGPLPFRQIDVVQTAYAPGALKHTGCLWLPREVIKEGGRTLAHEIRAFIAQQYFGRSAWAHPVSDAWLSDSVSEYLAYLILEESEDHDAYLLALNEDLVDALQLTIPGGLSVTSDASLFTEYEYDVVVLRRGAVVFHELSLAMGREALIAGLKLFYETGLQKEVLSERDLLNALDTASGASWEKYLTDWLFNVGDYVQQEIYWLD